MSYLGVETGGTRIRARIIDADGAAIAERSWMTTTPAEATAAIAAFVGDRSIAGAGIAAFGPLVVDPASPDYGKTLDTPKPHWAGSNLRAALADRLGCPVAVDSDVNAAAVAEQALGAGRGFTSVAYVTVGTGIGAGLALNGRSLVGALHPEVGHVAMIRLAGDDMVSACPFHANCAEGLAAGPAVGRRLAGRATLAEAPELLPVIAHYLGQLFAALVYSWSPQCIVAGGGVLSTPGLREASAAALREALGGYGVGPRATAPDFVRAPELADAGLEGALLAARAA